MIVTKYRNRIIREIKQDLRQRRGSRPFSASCCVTPRSTPCLPRRFPTRLTQPVGKVRKERRITRILTNGFAPICAIRGFLFRILTDHDKRSATNLMALGLKIPGYARDDRTRRAGKTRDGRNPPEGFWWDALRFPALHGLAVDQRAVLRRNATRQIPQTTPNNSGLLIAAY